VTTKIPAYLKLHIEESARNQASAGTPDSLRASCEAFEQATGWALRYESSTRRADDEWSAPVDSGLGQPAGQFTLVQPPAHDDDFQASEPVDPARARPLALAIAGLFSEANRLKHALWQREAELAAGVPISSRPDEEPHLAERLATVLRGGAEAVECQAAALDLLDDSTTTLKLRAAWGLPDERLLEPARPLRGAVAELEALVGHAVVLEDTAAVPHWRCPENYPAAMCVPVSSSSMPLGTLWIFSDQKRDFTVEQTNLIEIVAGRLAADLEREMLLATSIESKEREQQFALAARWQQERLPSMQPLVDGLEIAGWTAQAEEIGGDFHDWSMLSDGRLAIAVGDAQGSLLEAGLGAATMQVALKSHANYRHDAAQMLSRVSDTLWCSSAGDQFAALFYGLVNPQTGAVEFSLAGNAAAILVGRDCREIITSDAPLLGADAEAEYQVANQMLLPGEALVVLSEGARSAVDEAGLHIGDVAITSTIQRHLGESAQALATRLRKLLERSGAEHPADDMTVLVVKRRT
jgi:serine phosphatase RsbU (regulator of sigma subunit)